jgi:hypothetical protein
MSIFIITEGNIAEKIETSLLNDINGINDMKNKEICVLIADLDDTLWTGRDVDEHMIEFYKSNLPFQTLNFPNENKQNQPGTAADITIEKYLLKDYKKFDDLLGKNFFIITRGGIDKYREPILEKLHGDNTRHSGLDIDASLDKNKSKLEYFMDTYFYKLDPLPTMVYFLDDSHNEHILNLKYYKDKNFKEFFKYKSIMHVLRGRELEYLRSNLGDDESTNIKVMDGKKKRKSLKKTLRKKNSKRKRKSLKKTLRKKNSMKKKRI